MIIGCQIGDRSAETGKLLYDEVKHKNRRTIYMTDYWKPYKHFIPRRRHIQSKAETFTVEGCNSLLRHFIARLRRKSKCYSKSVQMLFYSLILFFKFRNNQLSILK